mmetsp:Transcript_5872/g.7100  ORF Transcript_5872/g.7100 Transcript_5872/m.7100 type:complete len:181 (+) Transcript_5872:109-651(+)
MNHNEVAACGWCKMKQLLKRSAVSHLKFTISHMFSDRHPLYQKAIETLGLDYVYFTKVDLETDDFQVSFSSTNEELAVLRSNFFLWGLTLGFVNDFLFNVTSIRSKPLNFSKECLGRPIEVVYRSGVHNIVLHTYCSLREMLFGSRPTWGEYTTTYPQLLLSTMGGSMAISTGMFLVSRL